MGLIEYLSGFEHDLRGVVEEGEGSLGEAVGAHEHGGEAHVGPPRVHHLLRGETLQPYEAQVDEPLHEREVPSVAAAYTSSVLGVIFLQESLKLIQKCR